jgi:hypothetical protein
MVTLARAAECIGRRVTHLQQSLRGTVESVDANDVWVKTNDGDIVPCIPAHLAWVSTLSGPLADAIEMWEPYENGQIGFAPWLWKSDDDVPPISNFGIVYSTALSNDDGQDRPLFAIPHYLRKVQVLSITANESTARDIEEVLGWATA